MVDQIRKLFSIVLVVLFFFSAEKGFAEEYPFTATLTCGMRGEHINILGCFSNTELEIQNGGDYRLYKIYEIHEAGEEYHDGESFGFRIKLKENFKIKAQNSDDTLVLSINIIKNSNGKSLFRKSVAQYGVIAIANKMVSKNIDTPPSIITKPPLAQIPKPPKAKITIKPPFAQTPKPAIQPYSGTGFMFGSKDYVITNWHVVRGTKNIKVKFLNGDKIKAEVLLKDSKNDIVFLKLKQSPQLPSSSLKLGDSSNVRMGDKVFTIGYPAHWVMGQNPKYTEGVVNALSGIRDDPKVFQISVQIQPGNSGGPLFNQNGEVIGITQASLDPQLATESIGALPQNVNYAIKSSYIKKLLPMLPETLVSNRGIVVVPTEPKNSLANFIDNAKKNIVLIEASTK